LAPNATDGRAETYFNLGSTKTLVGTYSIGERPWVMRLHVFEADTSPLNGVDEVTVNVYLDTSGTACATRVFKNTDGKNDDLSVLHLELGECKDGADTAGTNNDGFDAETEVKVEVITAPGGSTVKFSEIALLSYETLEGKTLASGDMDLKYAPDKSYKADLYAVAKD
jgi:hypothetical protein